MTDKDNSMGALYAALAKAQAAMGKAQKNAKNPHFRSSYADLGAVMDACMPALLDHGFALLQPIGSDDQGPYVETVLAHSSGESVSCRVPLIVGKNDMQGFGSAVTYARRYGLMSMAGIAPEDDDGNAAAKAAPRQSETRSNVESFDAAKEGRRIMAAIDAAQDVAALDALLEAEAETFKSFNRASFDKLHSAAAAKRTALTVDDSIPY